MGIALKNGIVLGVKLTIISFIMLYIFINAPPTRGSGVIVPLGLISPIVTSVIIMDQAKKVAREVRDENKSE
ncbi:hypothetical protein [Halorubrum ezzemoulense]|uniref:hypothetical protein n=1 Tax=Halorubrum ezzemoulense TaxID=337243 RepID=UPI00232C3E61|nr:hypothetical protein [Halorubrum ezzemoulense]MDB2242449.1 hypothetical protein [Halorubrum ezzemoulense]